ncbi:MAG: hypothetical protein HY332_13700 [Chloroflexi bacterium]|nr:hypothetical protein [Chloroflexota bacterium]
MSIFKKLFGGLLGGGGRPADDAIWLYVRCAACGETIRVRVSPLNDLSPEFEGERDYPTGYIVRKEIVGQNCFRRIHVEMTFDARRQPLSQDITGGTFITREEYESSRDAASA